MADSQERAAAETEMSGLEQRCIRPGLWLIEGHIVERSGGRCPRWDVLDPANKSVARPGTLAEARDWIREHRMDVEASQ